MIITFGKNTLTFKYTYLVAILLVLLTEGLFLEFIYGKTPEGQTPPEGPGKMIIMLAFLLSALHITRLPSAIRNMLIISYLYFLALSLESYYRSGSFFQYPHVFAKIMFLFLTFFIYPYFKNIEGKKLNIIMYLIFIAFVLNLFIYKSHILSISAFLDVNRGFSAAAVYLLVLPCLYFFNKYLAGKNIFNLLVFLAILGFIIFVQHRTVWLSMIFALLINFLLLRKSNINIYISTISPIILIPSIAAFLVFSLVLSTNPEIIEKFSERVSDISNADTQGTGSWRLQQFRSYQPFIEDNLLLGMRMEGFELPIQFYHEEAGIPLFADNTGHHFHSFYVDKLFYFGIIGLVITLLPFIYLIITAIRKPSLTVEDVVLVSYSVSALLYGFSYNFPEFVFGFLGVTLAFIDRPSPSIQHSSISDKHDHVENKILTTSI